MKTAEEWKKLAKVTDLTLDELVDLMIAERNAYFHYAGIALKETPLKVQMTGVVSDGPLREIVGEINTVDKGDSIK